MDHLPSPQNPYRPIKIPYLGGEDYDHLEFEGYPKRRGWTIEQISRLLISPNEKVGKKSSHDVGAFLQSWLFFGTLSYVFMMNNITISKDDFVQKEDGEGGGVALFVTTRRLPSYVAQYLEVERSLPYATRIHHRDSRNNRLKRVYREVFTFDSIANDSCSEVSSVLFSVLVLCTSLTSLLYGDRFLCTTDIKFLSSIMLREGWCPNHIAMISDVFSEASRYYIYLLGPPRVKKDHRCCTREVCTANQSDDAAYRTKHLQEDCLCGWVEPALQKIISICTRGGIPLISLSRQTDEDPLDCDVVEFESGISYLAMSHVWADGLGNPHRNALPICQMRALRCRVGTILPPGESKLHLWIDTLCVPLVPEHARKAAIVTMRRTYVEAAGVLVLDAELMEIPLPSSDLETRMRIVTSAWYSRLWTYQEGLLARSLYFQFQNGVACGQELYNAEKQSEDDKMRYGVSAKHLVWSYPRSAILGHGALNTSGGKLTLLEGLRWRSTTKMRDESICTAVLLNLDLEWLLKFPEDTRFKAMLETQHHFSKGMLFYSGPRMIDYGYRWAPKSFMIHGDPIPFGEDSADFMMYHGGAGGLCFQSIGLSLGPVRISANMTHFVILLPWEDSLQSLHLVVDEAASNFLDELVDTESPTELALVPTGDILGPLITNDTLPARGVLVAICSREQYIWFARYICCVLMTRSQADSSKMQNVLDLGQASIIPYQSWCVG